MRERATLVGLCLLVSFALTATLTFLQPREYSSRVVLYVSSGQGSGDASSAYQGNLLSEQRVKSYEQLVTSNRVMQEVIDTLRLRVTASGLASKVETASEADTVLLSISYRDRSPEAAAAGANAIGQSVVSLIAELERPAEANRQAPVVARLVEPASVPSAPVSPRTYINLGLGVLVGLIIGVSAALMRDRYDVRLKGQEKLRDIFGLPNLSAIPMRSQTSDRADGFADVADAGNRVTEAYKRLRANLRYVDLDAKSKAIVITSSIPGEGKTSVAAGLALTLAQAGSRVVVVEGDLRRPKLGAYLNVESAVGITSVLSGRANLDDALQRARSSVDVLVCGPVPPNPSEICASGQMAQLLGDLRTRYEYVIVDSPPLLPVVDGAVLAAACDGALLVARVDFVTVPQVARSVEALEAVSAKILGSVVIGAVGRDERSYGAYGSYVGQTAANSSGSSVDARTLNYRRSEFPLSGNSRRPSPHRRE
ncbi:polysaccharide biosynthesis tyrosine autokinase [Actinomycetospora cinnamomea]|uniref:polysaccharide biosynthesis tyrosine autokinase n=1 Tax=Actinomycetospora cinnamomea TaxID=663609 RepID=UPI003C2E31AE